MESRGKKGLSNFLAISGGRLVPEVEELKEDFASMDIDKDSRVTWKEMLNYGEDVVFQGKEIPQVNLDQAMKMFELGDEDKDENLTLEGINKYSNSS